MISTFPAKKKTIKNNILSAEITQARNEKGANIRTI
jgi:hypothetical protein